MEIIIECSQQEAVKNNLINFNNVNMESNIENQITPSRWTTQLPNNITLNPQDEITLQGATISTLGLSDDAVEITGDNSINPEMTDNAIKIKNHYYLSNNWSNNFMLPYGLSIIKNTNTPENYARNFNYQNIRNLYYNLRIDPNGSVDLPSYNHIFYPDYGAPSVGGDATLLEDWVYNSSLESRKNYNDLLQNTTSFPVQKDQSSVCCGNMKHYVPDNTRLYIGSSTWVGMYLNGHTKYRDVSLTGDYSGIFTLKESEANIEIKKGFNSPSIIGNQITQQLSNPIFDKKEFVEPFLIDYKNEENLPNLTNSKGYFTKESVLQVRDDTYKTINTTFGKMVYDTNNGVENFTYNSIFTGADPTRKNDIPLPNPAQRFKYMYNNACSGDWKRTRAICLINENLSKGKNKDDLNINNLSSTSIYTGDEMPFAATIGLPTAAPDFRLDKGYAGSKPLNFGEQIILFDDLTLFHKTLTQTEIDKNINNIIFRTTARDDYENISKPALTDKFLDLKNLNVVMTNQLANKMNIDKMKNVIELLERPSEDIKIDYLNQVFKDSLYFSQEIGSLDDNFSVSVLNIFNNATVKLPNVENGICLPVSLPCPYLATKYDNSTGGSGVIGYTNLVGSLDGYYNYYFPRLKLMAGLFCDEEQITNKNEFNGVGNNAYIYTYLNEWRSNKMYELDFYSRYNENRTPKSGNLVLPTNNFSFTDTNGNYFNDIDIVNNDLGIVVAYRKINNIDYPFIGYVARTQISQVDKYNIPMPSFGELFSLPRALQNNTISFVNTWENKVDDTLNNSQISNIRITNEGKDYSHPPTIEFEGGGFTTLATGFAVIADGHFKGITITNAGAGYKTTPTIKLTTVIGGSGGAAVCSITSERNSYNPENSLYPYIQIGANVNCSFDLTATRLTFSKLHTLMNEGQSSNNMLRYCDGRQTYNDSRVEIISPDSESSNQVIKVNRRRTEVNSMRAGFTEAPPLEDPLLQIIPINNRAIRSKGFNSSLSGIGISDLQVKYLDGTYKSVNIFNEYSYKGSLIDVLGLNPIQILPPFGNQNTFFNREKHNSALDINKPLTMFNNCVKPLTTNGFIDGSINQALNTNNLNFVMGQLDGINSLEKSFAQTSDALIFENLPKKFSYSHLLVYSNIVNKFNYIGGQQVNHLACIGKIDRSYEGGNFIYLNQTNPTFIYDINTSLSNIEIDIRRSNGKPAPINEGSTIFLQINKKNKTYF